MNKDEIVGFTVAGFTILLCIVCLVAIVNWTVKRSEHNECIKWAEQAQEYPKFYYTDWQKEQCGIK